MILTSIIIIKDGALSLIQNKKYAYSNWLIIVCIITIIIKLSLYLYTRSIGKKYNNLLVKANSKDHINDCILTTGTLLSCILARQNIFIFDGIVGTLIGTWILITGIRIFKESYDILMDKAIAEETKQEVYKIIKQHKEIKRTKHFNSTPIGYMYQISVTIYVDGNLTTFESHEIADNLEKEIVKNIDEIYLAVIHVNPIKTNESSNNK
jgi:cation diffusion facilitator family transporter